MERLNAGETLLLDGGTGSELQRRGVDVLTGATDRLKAWSATANVDNADVVQQVHQDYLRVGADIIISNNFWTIPSAMERIGMRDQWRRYATAAGENAVAARNAGNPEAYVAGGIAAPTLQGRSETDTPDVEQMGADAFREDYVQHSKLLADLGADLILAEYVGYIADCVAAVDACAESGLPVFLGVRHIDEKGDMQYGESLTDLVAALKGRPVDALLLMCSNPEAISTGLPIIRNGFDGPVGGYPNLGYNPMGPLMERPMLTNQKPSTGRDIAQNADYAPARMAEFARDWRQMGAQIIGGCCASGPEHVMAMKPEVKGT
jgi:S-methylmethionine-dependent homocysteine/selenocysteine methylase